MHTLSVCLMHIQHCFHKQILIRLSCVMAMPAQLLSTEILQEKYAHFIHTHDHQHLRHLIMLVHRNSYYIGCKGYVQ